MISVATMEAKSISYRYHFAGSGEGLERTWVAGSPGWLSFGQRLAGLYHHPFVENSDSSRRQFILKLSHEVDALKSGYISASYCLSVKKARFPSLSQSRRVFVRLLWYSQIITYWSLGANESKTPKDSARGGS